MSVLRIGTGGRNSLGPVPLGAPADSVTVSCTSIDEFCTGKAIAKIDLLKCDTEGHDPDVIRGALGMLRAERIRVLQFEYNSTWIHSRHYLKDVFDLLDRLPYHVGKLSNGRIELFQSWHPELERFFEANFVVIHHDSVRFVKARAGRFDASNTYS
jgi:hypothetical protein